LGDFLLFGDNDLLLGDALVGLIFDGVRFSEIALINYVLVVNFDLPLILSEVAKAFNSFTVRLFKLSLFIYII
jgi:hypothetical protein